MAVVVDGAAVGYLKFVGGVGRGIIEMCRESEDVELVVGATHRVEEDRAARASAFMVCRRRKP